MAGAPKGNTNAARDNRVITNALNRAVVQNPDKLRAACEKVIDEAAEGNLAAFAFIADRLEGKPAQTTVLEGGNKPVQVEELRRTIVDPQHTDS